ncbi:hypothetical protein C8K36_10558 [Rhodococcus sp. OK519]|nr:hypothetical protein C8K36_10558 [Rhodococcus sp. OK519]
MLGQKAGRLGVGNASGDDNTYQHSMTIQVRNRDTFADIALGAVTSGDESDYAGASCFIYQIVSDNGVENVQTPMLSAFRKNMTSITFAVATFNGYTRARWMLSFWS